MAGSLHHIPTLIEGTDYLIQKKRYFTFLYFKDLSKAQYSREQLSNKADLKENQLSVISKVIKSNKQYGYFFFVSEERLI